MNELEDEISQILIFGRENYGFLGIKAEFEAEGARLDEIIRITDIARRAGVKIAIKIGGCEAIRDLHDCKLLGADYIIAPMVETPYALSKYIDIKNYYYSEREKQDTVFLFNVETKTALDNLPALAKAAAAPNGVCGIVFGRSDFSLSLGLSKNDVDSEQVTNAVCQAADACKQYDMDFVVGGAMNAASIPNLKRMAGIRLNRFETRKIIVDAKIINGKIVEALQSALKFELLWLKNKREMYKSFSVKDDERIKAIEKRFAS